MRLNPLKYLQQLESRGNGSWKIEQNKSGFVHFNKAKNAVTVLFLLLAFVLVNKQMNAQMLKMDSLKKMLKAHNVKFVTSTRFQNNKPVGQSKLDGDYNLVEVLRYYPNLTIEYRETYTTFGSILSEDRFDSTANLVHRVIYEYDKCNNLVGRIEYDGSGKVISVSRDSLSSEGEHISSTSINYYGETKHYPGTVIKRNAAGKVLSITGYNTNTLGFVYDASGKCIEDSVRGYAYDERHNWYTYDSEDRLIAIRSACTPNGWPEILRVNYFYNISGQVVREVRVRQSQHPTFLEYDSLVTKYSADRFGPIKEEQRFQPKLTRTIKSYWAYDSLTQKRIFIEQITSVNLNLTWPCDSTFYDSDGRVLLYREYAYVNPGIITTDETIYTYNKIGLLSEITNNRSPGSKYGYTTKVVFSYEF